MTQPATRLCGPVQSCGRAAVRTHIFIKALHGNPFDGQTLGPVVAELEALTGVETRRIHVDKGYRGHNPLSDHLAGRSVARRRGYYRSDQPRPSICRTAR